MRRLALLLACAAAPAAAQDPIGVLLEIDPAASARLAQMGEWVVVDAAYFGAPASADAPVDEMGTVPLGGERRTLYPVTQLVELDGVPGTSPVDWVTAPMVNVNVYTARVAAEDNLLDCGLIEGPVAEVAASGDANVIACTWLGD